MREDRSTQAAADGAGAARRRAPGPAGNWLGPALALFTVASMLVGLEVGLRVWLGAEQQRALPNFGVSETVQSRLAWQDWQARRDEYGTTSYPSSFDRPDPVLGWRVRPDADVRHVKPGIYEVSVHTNNRGMRGTRSVALAKPANLTRVGVFGCSQTFGETVDDKDTYVARLDENLPAEFLNFGVRGYGTDQMLLYYEREAPAYDLDVVVLAFAFYHMKRNASGFLFYAKPYFSLANDGELELAGTPVPSPEELEREDLTQQTWQFADRSVSLRWLWGRIRNWRARGLYAEDGTAWQLSSALITRFVRTARAAGSHVVLLNIDEAHPELEDDLEALAGRLSVDLVDLGPVLRQAEAAAIPYTLPNDNHWNATGHAIVADHVQEHLCSRGLVPDCNGRLVASAATKTPQARGAAPPAASASH